MRLFEIFVPHCKEMIVPPKKRNLLQATGDFVRETMKTQGLKRQIKKKQAQVADIHRGKQQLGRAMQGGAVGGLSGRAASRLASDPSAFNGGSNRKKGGGSGYR